MIIIACLVGHGVKSVQIVMAGTITVAAVSNLSRDFLNDARCHADNLIIKRKQEDNSLSTHNTNNLISKNKEHTNLPTLFLTGTVSQLLVVQTKLKLKSLILLLQPS